MALYGYHHIDNELMKKWIGSWDEAKITQFEQEHFGIVDEKISKMLSDMVSRFKNIVMQTTWSADPIFDQILPLTTQALIYCYFRSGRTAAKAANFYEILIQPANVQTQKKMIRGYDYISIGGIDIFDKGVAIGHIGEMSDLFWHTFFDKYRHESSESMECIRDNDHDLTLQLWKPEFMNYTADEIDEYVEQVIFRCSVIHDLEFIRGSYSEDVVNPGVSGVYELDMRPPFHERFPIQYFNFANYTEAARLKFLAYYQMIEYYYQRANDITLVANLKAANIDKTGKVDYRMLRRAVVEYNKHRSELNALSLVLKEAVDLTAFQDWLSKNGIIGYFSCRNSKYPNIKPLDFRNLSGITKALSERIYAIRCSLVHSKAESVSPAFIPGIDDDFLEKELPLIRWVALTVLEKWGKT